MRPISLSLFYISAQPLAAETTSLIKKLTPALRSQIKEEIEPMKWANRATAIGVFILAGVWIYLARQVPFPEFARVAKMGPGHYPAAVAILLMLLAVVFFIQTFQIKENIPKNGDDEEIDTRNPKARQHLLTGFALFAAYVILVPFLGFGLTSALFIFFFIRLIGDLDLLITIAFAIGIPAFLWTVFAFFLTVPLPKGPWGF